MNFQMPEDPFFRLVRLLGEYKVKVKKGVVSSAKHTINIQTHQK